MGISVREIAKVECFGSTVEGMSTIGKAAVGVDAADAKFKIMGDTMDYACNLLVKFVGPEGLERSANGL